MGDWFEQISFSLYNTAEGVASDHVENLVTQGYLGTTRAEIQEWAEKLLRACEKGDRDLLSFHAPRPAPVRDRRGFSRQYDRARGRIGRERAAPLGEISNEDQLELWISYVDGLSMGFYGALLDWAPEGYEPCDTPQTAFLRYNLR